MGFTDDPEVFERTRYGEVRQVDSTSDADGILDGFEDAPALMRFRLVYEGNLPAAGNKHTRAPDKWVIRRKLHPQLAGLWATHPTLQGRGVYAKMHVGWGPLYVHDSL